MNKTKLLKIGFISQFILIFALSTNTSSAAKLYKWVDDQGRISYQGKPPPINSKILSEKTLKDKSGDKKQADKKLNSTPVDIYVSKSCVSCDAMIELFEEWGVPYSEKLIDDHRDIHTRLRELTGGVRVPALFNGDDFVEGTNNEANLKLALQKTGHLRETASEDIKQAEESTEQ